MFLSREIEKKTCIKTHIYVIKYNNQSFKHIILSKYGTNLKNRIIQRCLIILVTLLILSEYYKRYNWQYDCFFYGTLPEFSPMAVQYLVTWLSLYTHMDRISTNDSAVSGHVAQSVHTYGQNFHQWQCSIWSRGSVWITWTEFPPMAVQYLVEDGFVIRDKIPKFSGFILYPLSFYFNSSFKAF